MSYRDSLPRRWIHCPRMSEELIMEKFLAFKTPLSEHYDFKMQPDSIFHPNQIFEHVKSVNRKMGLWIDLTNTERYFNRKEIENNHCTYVKMMCKGHDEPPPAEIVRSFISIVANFMRENPLDIIGVHCTNGFNRTGFMIVAFMIEAMDFKVDAAIDAFSRARPPGIYKEDYLKELYGRYACETDATLAPPLPDWCLENDDSA